MISENDLKNYVNYMAKRKINSEVAPSDEEEISLSNINSEVIKGNKELLRTIRFIDTAPDMVQKEQIIKSYVANNKQESLDETIVFAPQEELTNNKETKLVKAQKKALTIQNSNDYGFSYVVILTVIVTVLFFALIFFTLN